MSKAGVISDLIGGLHCYYDIVTVVLSVLPSFAMDTAHNFGPEFRSEKPVRVLHENKISRIFSPTQPTF